MRTESMGPSHGQGQKEGGVQMCRNPILRNKNPFHRERWQGGRFSIHTTHQRQPCITACRWPSFESVGSRSVEGSRSLLHLTPPTSWKLAGVRPWGVSLLSLVRKANFSLEKETSVPPVEHLCPLHGSQLCSLKWGHVVNVQFHGPSR